MTNHPNDIDLSPAEILLFWVVVALATCVAAGFVAGLIDSYY